MNKDDIFEELIDDEEDEFDIFLDTLKEVFEYLEEKGFKHHER